MSTLYFFMSVLCSCVQSIQTSMQNLESLAQKMSELCLLQYSLLLRSRLCLKGSRQGHLLRCHISQVSNIPQISFTPQNVAIDKGINLRVVPTSQDTHGNSYYRGSRLQQIYSLCFSPNLPGFKFVQYVVLLLKQKRCG